MMEVYKKWLVLAAVVCIILYLFFWSVHQKKDESVPITTPQEQLKEAEQTVMFVDIKGAVAREGVYEFSKGTRVKDAIAKAGGLLQEADSSKINLAQFVHDQMLLYVPNKTEGASLVSPQTNKIAINIASKEEIEKIPGIGPKKAESIIRYREENGPFQTVEDLLEVDGIGEKSLANIKEQIVVP
ncbi:helix-hairpin-helix domain-containing protein [Ectobacillus antri]|jgi:competence protein ComEA|uniref:Helix-hairpin-helix domain-containing protein n=1 Tax=Ectobacillus antri TaxID=2486280 RepID=A0ABT6H1P5_9BACI|nr:helix-hairpin-helix domain-containing protein [Ectobacillus antri]MDG4655469.1 helix-hairpin-helix domain-containing protein [Ectobacillus antri]MDG5753227.1 helix-hairpin-helix domain-containing protein [Ectobacillus antri]